MKRFFVTFCVALAALFLPFAAFAQEATGKKAGASCSLTSCCTTAGTCCVSCDANCCCLANKGACCKGGVGACCASCCCAGGSCCDLKAGAKTAAAKKTVKSAKPAPKPSIVAKRA